ncbi:DUF3265 domain-containing protein [Vibrio parahaemolyticus]|nr:DUF3265 domain-containing protein [Vibrio parahaemolyticus]MBM4937070.1 DUF3265 domain-containing protein [Vibrio parahaemolyticus]
MIRHAWHFYYALVLVIKVVCGSIVLRASHLNWALWRSQALKSVAALQSPFSINCVKALKFKLAYA